jgi:hypothetical protein
MTVVELRPHPVDINVWAGAPVSLEFTATLADAPVDLSGATIVAQILTATGVEATTFGQTISGAGDNVLTLTLTGVKTTALLTSLAGSPGRVSVTVDGFPWLGGSISIYPPGSAKAQPSFERTFAVTTGDGLSIAVEVIGGAGGGGAVDSVNGATGVVVLDADDIDDTSTTNKFATAAQLSAVDGLASTYQPLDADLTTLAAGNIPTNLNASLASQYAPIAEPIAAAHISDTTGAHDATAIVVGDVFNSDFTVDDVSEALVGLDDKIETRPTALNMASSTVGHYVSPVGADSTIGVGSFINRFQNLYLYPFFMPAAVTVDRIAIEVTTPGTGVLRLGLYDADAVAGGGGTLLLDAGTVDPSTTGYKEATVSTTIPAGWTLFGIVWQTTSTTAPAVRTKSQGFGVLSSTTASSGLAFPTSALTVGSVTGALPGSPTIGNGSGLSVAAGNPASPSIAFRRA